MGDTTFAGAIFIVCIVLVFVGYFAVQIKRRNDEKKDKENKRE